MSRFELSIKFQISAALVGLSILCGQSARADVVVGNVDIGNSQVQRFSETNGSTVAAGQVGAGSGGLDGAAGVAFGPDGHLYVSSKSTSQILQYDGKTGAFDGVFATLPGFAPAGLKFGPDNNLYVADNGGQVQEFVGPFGAPGTVGNHVGAVTSGLGAAGNVLFAANGDMYASDFANGQVVKIDHLTHLQSTFIAPHAGGLSAPGGMLLVPSNTPGGGQDLLVVDLYSFNIFDPRLPPAGNDILRFDSSGALKDVFATIAPPPTGLFVGGSIPFYVSNFPSDIIFNRDQTGVYVAVLGKDFSNSGQILQYGLNDTASSEATPTGWSKTGQLAFAAITLSPVPEPSTVVLASLAAAGLWLARRRPEADRANRKKD